MPLRVQARMIASAALLLLAGGCRERWRVELPSEPGEVVLLVRASPSGTVRELWWAEGGAPAALELADDDRILAAVLPAGSLVTEEGEPFLPVLSASGPGASCGRCLVPAAAAPQRFSPGDSCPLPRFARLSAFAQSGTGPVTLDGASLLAELSPRVRLERAGECACAPPRLASGRLEWCAVFPPAAPLVPDAVRYNNRGELSTWTLSGGLRVDAAGRARVITGPAVRGDLLTTAETADGQSLVLSGPPGAVREGILNEAFAPDDQRRLVPDVGEIEATRALDLDQDGTMYLLGIRRVNQQEEHVVRRCETAGWTCQDVPLVRAGRCALGERRPSAALRFAEGDSLLVVGDGRMYTRTAGGDRFYCEPSTDALRVELRSASRPLRGFVGSARLGRRVFLSGYVESSREEGPLSVILTTTVGLTTGEPPLARVLRFALVGGGEQPVGTFIPHPERSDRLLFHPQDSGQLLELDVDGRVVGQEEVSQRFPELGERPLVMSHEHGWVVARSGSGVIHRRRVAEPRFTRVFGPDLADPWFSSALVLGDELWLFHEGPVRRLSASAGAQCLQQAGPVPQISGYPSGVVAKLALPDSRGPGWAVLAVEGPTNALLFLDLRAQEVRSIQRLGTEQMLAGAELSPGRWVMIERSGRAYLVEEDGRQALEPILDDPTTPANESPVSELRWTTVSAAGGVAWLGAQGALGRVVLAAEGPRLEAYWLAQKTGGGYADFGRADGTRFQAAAALCPDDVVIASRELPVASPTGIGDRERHLLWRLGPGCGDELCEEGSHEARPEVSPSGTAVARALVAHAGGVTAVYDDGVLRREGSPRTAAPSPALDAGLAFSDLVVVLRGKHLFAARVLR